MTGAEELSVLAAQLRAREAELQALVEIARAKAAARPACGFWSLCTPPTGNYPVGGFIPHGAGDGVVRAYQRPRP